MEGGKSTLLRSEAMECKKFKVGESRKAVLRVVETVTKKFHCRAKKGGFHPSKKCLLLLTETRFFSQRFIKAENRVNPTVGFRIRFSLW